MGKTCDGIEGEKDFIGPDMLCYLLAGRLQGKNEFDNDDIMEGD